MTILDRRLLLRSGLGALTSLGLSRRAAAGAAADGPALVLVQLSGGNDGLSTLIPIADDAYHAARRATRHREVLALDEYRGLHPGLVGLHARYHDGGLAIVQGVGYPRPNRSHFKSFEIWHTADERGRAVGAGWIGRLCEAAFTAPHPNRVVHVGPRMPYALFSSRHPAAAFTTPAGYRWVRNEDELAALERDDATANEALALLRERMREARVSSAALRRAVLGYRTPIDYPDEPFAEALRSAAALLDGDVGVRVLSVELGGFDTHNDQRSSHDRLMATLDAGLGAFLGDLERSAAGRAAVVVVFSEFGRRVRENGSRGTDHGTAGPLLVAGGRVRGGLFGEHPSLTELDDGEDLIHTTDFRSVYQAVLEACFEVDAARVLGRRHPPLALIG